MADSSTPFLINKNLRLFVFARFFFILAMQMVIFAVAWHLYGLTHNQLSLGLLGLSEIIPAISLALYAGHVIDKSDKRSMLQKTMTLYLLAVVGLCFITTTTAEKMLGLTGLEIAIYLLYFCTGIFRAFTGPTMASIVAQLVTREELPRAITISSTAWQSAAVTGPVLSGILISQIGMTNTFITAICLLLIPITLISLIPKLPVLNTRQAASTWESMKQGLRYVFKTKELLGAMSLDMFAVFFGGATAMLPVFAKDILHISAEATGTLRAAQSIGSILIMMLISRYPIRHHHGRTLLQCVAMFGICIIVFAISRNYWLSFACLFFSGLFDGVSMIIRSTILQLYVPDDMRGRVSSVSSMFVNSSNELGEFESGVAARLMGTVPSVVFGGCMTILVVTVAWLKAPKLRKLEY